MTPDDRHAAAKAHGYDTPTPRPFSVCHGCGDVTRRQVEALEAQLADARAEVERLQERLTEGEAVAQEGVNEAIRLTIERDQARAALARVEAVRDEWAAAGAIHGDTRSGRIYARAAAALRAALTPTTGTEQQS